jgi:hypothetical protein
MTNTSPSVQLRNNIELFKKVYALADRYGVRREGSPGWGFFVALELAREIDRDFTLPALVRKRKLPSPALKRKRGRPLVKGVEYQMRLAVELAAIDPGFSQRGAKAQLARLLTDRRGKGLKRSKFTEKERKNRTRQFENDLSKLGESHKEIAAFCVRRIMAGASSVQLCAELAELEQSDPESAREIVRKIGEYIPPNLTKNRRTNTSLSVKMP